MIITSTNIHTIAILILIFYATFGANADFPQVGGILTAAAEATSTATPLPASTSPSPSSMADPRPLPEDVIFIIGYLRMAADDLDSANTLSSLLATVRYYNVHRLARGVFFQLNVTTVMCPSLVECQSIWRPPSSSSSSPMPTTASGSSDDATAAAAVDQFIRAMPYMSVVLRPNFIVASRIVDEAMRIGCLVVNPEDMRMEAFSGAASENIIQLHQNWESQGAHLFAYFQQADRCAYAGIVHDNANLPQHDYISQIRQIQKIFTDGAFPLPPEIDISISDDEVFKNFFLSDSPRRRCFIVLGTNGVLAEMMRRLTRAEWYVANNYRFYGFNTLIVSDLFVLLDGNYNSNGAASAYANTFFTSWIPTMTSTTLETAYAEWLAHPNPTERALYGPTERVYEATTAAKGGAFSSASSSDSSAASVAPTLLMMGGYLTMRLVLDTLRDAVGYATDGALYAHYDSSAATTSGAAITKHTYPLYQPLSWSAITDAFYRYARQVDGHWFNHLVRKCPRYPAEQVCHCNTMTANSYIYKINGTTGVPFIVYNNPLAGDRDIAAPSFYGSCGYNTSAWAYPLTGLTLFPTTLIGRVGYREEDVVRHYNEFQATYGESVAAANWAKVRPVRAFRYAAYNVDDDADPTAILRHYIDTIKPFVIFGTMGLPITDSGTTLTLDTDLLGLDLEDPPLRAFGSHAAADHQAISSSASSSSWKWNIVQLRPTMADYIHALVAYYDDKAELFTSLHAIAQTKAEAVLIHKSFATFGFDVPMTSILVTNNNLLWTTTISSWISNAGSYNPFVLASAHANNNSDVRAVAKIAAALGRGTLALACDLPAVYNARKILDFSTYNTQGDIIFGFFGRETWIPEARSGVPDALLQYVDTSTAFQVAMLGIELTKALAGQVYYDYTMTAAEVLYNLGTVTARGASFGPFYNDTCDDETIRLNSRDRRCQCTKGLRTVYVHSMRNFVAGTTSARTGRYSYTMNTCGVEYKPYAPPNTKGNNAALSSAGAIAGITVACVLVVGACIALLLVLLLTGGRNNKFAPKDSTRPFTIVFTDIQSSTSLWARAPHAMSDAVEQHHAVVRRCIRRHDGYEVKTVGDSFMVAFAVVEDAVRFAIDIQVTMHAEEWNSEIDATYVELLLEAEAAAIEEQKQRAAAAESDAASSQKTEPTPSEPAPPKKQTFTTNRTTNRFHFFMQSFGPLSSKYRMAVVAKLGEAWGFEKASSAVYSTEGNRTRLLVNLLGKITKTFAAIRRRRDRSVLDKKRKREEEETEELTVAAGGRIQESRDPAPAVGDDTCMIDNGMEESPLGPRRDSSKQDGHATLNTSAGSSRRLSAVEEKSISSSDSALTGLGEPPTV